MCTLKCAVRVDKVYIGVYQEYVTVQCVRKVYVRVEKVYIRVYQVYVTMYNVWTLSVTFEWTKCTLECTMYIGVFQVYVSVQCVR